MGYYRDKWKQEKLAQKRVLPVKAECFIYYAYDGDFLEFPASVS